MNDAQQNPQSKLERLLERGFRYAVALTHDDMQAEDLIQEACMRMVRKKKPRHAACFFTRIVWIFLLSGMYSLFVPNAMFGIQTVSAGTPLGILGQQAPEIYLNTWIDGNGRKIAPIRLSDYRGKVIYLYFFQDW